MKTGLDNSLAQLLRYRTSVRSSLWHAMLCYAKILDNDASPPGLAVGDVSLKGRCEDNQATFSKG